MAQIYSGTGSYNLFKKNKAEILWHIFIGKCHNALLLWYLIYILINLKSIIYKIMFIVFVCLTNRFKV